MCEYPEAAVERAMKVHEVILRAMSKRIEWWPAALLDGSYGLPTVQPVE
jgi:hypothetical protein